MERAIFSKDLLRMPRPRVRTIFTLLTLGSTLALQGCMITEQLRREADAAVTAPPPPVFGVSVPGYLELMNGLSTADAVRQADLFYEVERDYTRAPTTSGTLRYAVALITAGHPASDPLAGKTLLEALLATPQRLTQEERTFATVVLHETENRLRLEAENRRLLATLDDRIRSQANSDRRIQAQIDENARLRRALADAQQKLDAIKEIERSIIERSATPLGNRDAAAAETQGSTAGR